MFAAQLATDAIDDFSWLRKSAGLCFGIDELVIYSDIEDTSRTADQFDRRIKFFFEDFFQTGSLGEVVSGRAVSNAYFHAGLLGKKV